MEADPQSAQRRRCAAATVTVTRPPRRREAGAISGLGVFVTGTDTGVGKTRVSLGLLSAANALGYRTAAMKPVSAGCTLTPQGLRNADALSLQREATLERPYELVNPVAYAPPIAPHVAAAESKRPVDLRRIQRAYSRLSRGADFCVVEGAGGWLVPLGPRTSLADLAERLALPVVLVVGIRLGCLNHALLSVESIRQRDVVFAGWVANVLVAEEARPQANIDALRTRIDAPLLARVPYRCRAGPSIFRDAFEGPHRHRLIQQSSTPGADRGAAVSVSTGNRPGKSTN